MKILLVDDHPVVREGLKLILADFIEGASFGEAGDAQAALDLLGQQEWDLVFLDLMLPGRSGVEVLREVKRAWPHLPVLIFSMHPEDHLAEHLIKEGASGYLLKTSSEQVLIKAIRRALAGERHLSEQLAERVAEHAHVDFRNSPHEHLTPRETQILRLIASGRPVGQIAKELSLSVHTIAAYRKRVLEKMHLKGNSQLTTYAIQHGLVEKG
jgi:two-component system invasion response regulator UvrY